MFVCELEFTSVGCLAGAYELVALDGGIAECAIELDELRLTFRADSPRAERLLERIHSLGGLLSARRSGCDQSGIDSSTSITGIPSSTG